MLGVAIGVGTVLGRGFSKDSNAVPSLWLQGFKKKDAPVVHEFLTYNDQISIIDFDGCAITNKNTVIHQVGQISTGMPVEQIKL